jgi:hypothetical protein
VRLTSYYPSFVSIVPRVWFAYRQRVFLEDLCASGLVLFGDDILSNGGYVTWVLCTFRARFRYCGCVVVGGGWGKPSVKAKAYTFMFVSVPWFAAWV